MLRFFTTIVVLGATLAATAAPALAQEGEFFEVTVRRGDSCARIAQRYYGDWRRYDVIIRYNPELQEGAPGGRCGPNLRPGVVLRLPRDPGAAPAPAETTPDARLTAARRDVQAREPEDADWRPASRGLGLFRGWRVNTLEASTAEVTFRDTSTVHMRENTLVIIYGGEARTARRQTTRARLERGTLRSRLGELRLDVDTPSSNASLDGGAAVVVVDEEGTSRVSNFDGGAARVRGATGGRVNVRPGYGSEVRRGRRPSRPRPLPPAPRWSEDGPTHFLGVVGAGGTLRGAWDPVPVARTYRVEVGLGDPGGAVLAATEVDAEVTRFELRGLPAGRYWARVSTIDAAFFEGRPSGPKRFELVHVDLRAPGAGATEDLEPDPSLAPRAPRTLVGSAIVAPEGFRCRRGGGDDTLDVAGEAELRCVGPGGESYAPLAVEVVAPRIDSGPPADRPRLRRGAEATLEWGLSSPVPLPELELQGQGVDVLDLERVSEDRIRARMRVADDAPDVLDVALVAAGVTLATERYDVQGGPASAPVAAPPPAPAPPPSAVHMVFADLPHPAVLPLEDERRQGHAVSVGGGFVGRRPGRRGYARMVAGLELAAADDRVRVGVRAPFDFSTQDAPDARGNGDLVVLGRGLLLRGRRGALSLDVDGWVPLARSSRGELQRPRFAPGLSASLRLGGRVTLRTRQGGIFDVNDPRDRVLPDRLWASAYGVDLRLARGLSLGGELDLSLGSRAGEFRILTMTGAALAYRAGPVQLALGARYGASFDARRDIGRWTFAGALRLALGDTRRAAPPPGPPSYP